MVGGRHPFRLKFAFKVTHLTSKNADFDSLTWRFLEIGLHDSELHVTTLRYF